MNGPDLLLEEPFLPGNEELFVILLTEIEWDERMQARKTASSGRAYDYSGISYDSVPMHPLLVPIVDKTAKRRE